MKILEVASSLYDWGGIERYVAYLTSGLRARGHQVEVVCPPDSPLDKRIESGKIYFDNRAQFSPATYFAYRKIARRLKPDLAHVHFSPDFILPAMAIRQASSAKLVMTRHLVLPWKRAKVTRYLRLFDHFIPVSDAVRKKLAESGIPNARMSVAKAGVPSLVTQSGRHENANLVVGSFGRLVPEKGVDVLLRAISLVQGIQVRIYGDGPAMRELRQLADGLNVGDAVEFTGFVPDVADAMAAVDVVCIPSVWDEAFPYSALEAMSIGKAVVASATGGLPEIVQGGATGRLFPRGDEKALAAILSECASDRESLNLMGNQGRELHRREYTVERMAERIEAVFEAVHRSAQLGNRS